MTSEQFFIGCINVLTYVVVSELFRVTTLTNSRSSCKKSPAINFCLAFCNNYTRRICPNVNALFLASRIGYYYMCHVPNLNHIRQFNKAYCSTGDMVDVYRCKDSE